MPSSPLTKEDHQSVTSTKISEEGTTIAESPTESANTEPAEISGHVEVNASDQPEDVTMALNGSRQASVDQSLDHVSAQQQFLAAAVELPWERAVVSNKVPYYIK